MIRNGNESGLYVEGNSYRGDIKFSRGGVLLIDARGGRGGFHCFCVLSVFTLVCR